MLKITLYKECILSHEYSEVFHHSIFESYLNTLNKKIIPNLDLVYYENEGTLLFDYKLSSNENIYDYNYMKVDIYKDVENEDETEILLFTRYCFIRRIRLKNELCYVDYEEDYWQSYSKDLHIRGSYLSRSKFLLYTNNNISIKNLPIEYDGHNPLYFERLYNHTDQYVVILQVQKYNAAAIGDSTKRKSFTTCLGILEGSANNYNFRVVHTLDVALYLIKKAYEATQRQISVSSEDYYFQIGNITLIPYNLFNENNIITSYFPQFENSSLETIKAAYENINNIIFAVTPTESDFCLPELKHDDYLNLAQGKKEIYHFTIQNDFKNYSIGTMTNQFELVNNGLDNEVYLYVDWNEFNFDLYLEFDKKMVSITNDFVINIPYSYLNGEELSQQRMARAMRNIKSVGNIVESVTDIGLTVGTAGANKMINLATKTPKLFNSLMAKGYRGAKQKLSDINEEKGILGGASGIAGGITGLIETNAPNYSASKGTFSYEDAILNAYTGICLKKIISQNDNLVTRMINETGYITYQIGGDEFLENYDSSVMHSNILKFDFVKAYGKFSQEICDRLKDILINGIKIWYNANV